MPLHFNGTEVDTLVFNGVEADSYIHNGVEVYSSANVAANILFSSNFRLSDNLADARSFVYRLNYDSLSPTLVYTSPYGSTISSIVWDPDTNHYYLSERYVRQTGLPLLVYTLKKSTNNGGSWSTLTTIESSIFNPAQGKLAVVSRNRIEFYIGVINDVESPGRLRCMLTTNGSSWSTKWTTGTITNEVVSNIVPIGAGQDIAVTFADQGGTVKARILNSNGNTTQTLTDSSGVSYHNVFWSRRYNVLYWSRIDNNSGVWQLRTTNMSLGNAQVIDSSTQYLSMGPIISDEAKLYYGVGYDIRSHDNNNVVHEFVSPVPIWSIMAKGRNIVAGGVDPNSPAVVVSYNRGVNWHVISLPNSLPGAGFKDVGNIAY